MSSLNNIDCYWGDISRAQANDLLHNAEDGTYLLRKSVTNPGDFTLTVKKDGINKMMRILCRNGKYGFCEPLEFDSIQSLIDFYSKNQLVEYNQEMTIKLKNPFSKSNVYNNILDNAPISKDLGTDYLFNKLINTNQDYIQLMFKYDNLYDNLNKSFSVIQTYKQALEGFNEAIAILEEQIKLNEVLQKEAMVHELSQMIKHREALKLKLQNIRDQSTNLEEKLKIINLENRNLDREIIEIKPLLLEKKRHQEQITALLIKEGVKQDLIEKRLEQNFIKYTNSFDLNSTDSSSTINKNSFSSSTETASTSSSCQSKSTVKMEQNYPFLNYTHIDAEYLEKTLSKIKYNLQNVNLLLNLPENEKKSDLCKTNAEKINDLSYEKKCLTTNEDLLYLNTKNYNKNNELNKLTSNRLCLSDVEWYVGNVTKEDANEMMNNLPDGTFLLRDSKNKLDAPYTLTVRVKGTTKMMHILRCENRFGLKEPLEFDSVFDLIYHYMNEPLIVNKPDIVIHLKYPWSKFMVKNK